MKKLKLGMDALRVETFETLALALPEVGTGQARQGMVNAFAADEGTEASDCASCDTCQGPNCDAGKCANSTYA